MSIMLALNIPDWRPPRNEGPAPADPTRCGPESMQRIYEVLKNDVDNWALEVRAREKL